MSTQQRVLISIGGSLLVVMMVVAAFAVGFYVGGGDSTSSTAGPFAGGPGAPPGDGGPLGGPLPAGLSRPPDLVGTVEGVVDDALDLQTEGGRRTVVMDADTEVVRPDGSQGAREDLGRGTEVAVLGRIEAGGRTVVAETIVVLRFPP